MAESRSSDLKSAAATSSIWIQLNSNAESAERILRFILSFIDLS